MDIKLTLLSPEWLKRDDDKHMHRVNSIDDADGIMFKCPKCMITNRGPYGTHSVICWRPHVPQSMQPKPGRWEFQGSGFDDLTLVAGSSSILLTSGCKWHGFIRNGVCTDA